MKKFFELGIEIEQRWQLTGYSDRCFTEIAYQCMAAARLEVGFAPEALIRDFFSQPVPTQLDPGGQYGQPPLTLYNSGRFVVDVYFFVTPESPIHDHDFGGAFVNLQGDSLHSTYGYHYTPQAGQRLFCGQLVRKATELLSPGSPRAIEPATLPGTSFIHRVWHLDRPTIIAIARMKNSVQGGEAYRYFEHGLALRERNWSGAAYQKRLRLLSYLVSTDLATAERLVPELLAHSDIEVSPHLLMAYYRLLLPIVGQDAAWQRIQDIAGQLEAQHGYFIGRVGGLLRVLDLDLSTDMSRLYKKEHRVLVALLRTFETRAAVSEWLLRLYPGLDVPSAIVTWLAEMAQDGALSLEITPAHLQVLRRLLVTPQSPVAAGPDLAATDSPCRVPESGDADGEDALAAQLAATDLLRPLFQLATADSR